MAGMELEQREDQIDSEEEVEITPRQVAAIEKLYELGAAPRANDEEPYSKDAQIRAYQMLAEGKIGGNRGGGRKSNRDRVTKALVRRNRRKLAKLEKVIDDALDGDDLKLAMDAVKFVAQLDIDESKQSLREEQADSQEDEQDKEALVLALIEQFRDPQVEAAIRSRADFIDLPASAVREVTSDDNGSEAGTPGAGEHDNGGSPAAVARPRVRRAKPAGARAGATPGDPDKRSDPWAKVGRRRAAD